MEHPLTWTCVQALKACYNLWDNINPISLDDVNHSNEWLVGEMYTNSKNIEDDLIFYDNNLT